MSQGKWTRAKVKHKTGKWYWIREKRDDGTWFPLSVELLSATASGQMFPEQERWSEPIKEPK